MIDARMEYYYARIGNTLGAVRWMKREYRFYRFFGTDREKIVMRGSWKQLIRGRNELWRHAYKREWHEIYVTKEWNAP